MSDADDTAALDAPIDAAARRRAGLTKWAAHPADVVPAWIAEHDLIPPPEVLDAVRAVADARAPALGYTRRVDELGSAYAGWARRRHGVEVDPEWVLPVIDGHQGLWWCATAFAAPGEGVVVTPPIYPPFLELAPTSGRRTVSWPWRRTGAGWVLDPDELDAVLRADPGARVVVLAHPHNPTGRVLDAAALGRILAVAATHDVVVVSDEFHADLVHPPTTFTSALAVPGAADDVVVVTSPAKTFSLSGSRAAVVVAAAPERRDRLRAAHPPGLLGHLGRVGIDVAVAAWTHGDTLADEVRTRLTDRRDQLAARLATEAPAVAWHPPEATFLGWLDISACGLGPDPAAALLDRARLAVVDGRAFGAGGEGHVRVNFGTGPEVVDEIVDRLVAAIT